MSKKVLDIYGNTYPEYIWSTCVHQRGLLSTEPIKMFLDKNEINLRDQDTELWWSADKLFGVKSLGCYSKNGCLIFSSIVKKDVENFIIGARSVLGFQKNPQGIMVPNS